MGRDHLSTKRNIFCVAVVRLRAKPTTAQPQGGAGLVLELHPRVRQAVSGAGNQSATSSWDSPVLERPSLLSKRTCRGSYTLQR